MRNIKASSFDENIVVAPCADSESDANLNALRFSLFLRESILTSFRNCTKVGSFSTAAASAAAVLKAITQLRGW